MNCMGSAQDNTWHTNLLHMRKDEGGQGIWTSESNCYLGVGDFGLFFKFLRNYMTYAINKN